jgi:hypothetical protein
MSRKNGGIIGPANTPVGGLMAGSASGVWRMNDLLDFVGNSQWPLAPQDIENSTRFNSGSSDSLTRTPSSAGNRKTWTWSGWVKRSILSSGDQAMFNAHTDSQNHVDIYFDSNDDLYVTVRISNTAANLITDAKFRDVSAWYHVVVAVDTTQSTNSDRMKLYVNGSQITSFSEAGYPSQDADTAMNNTVEHRVGDSSIETFFNGYMAEVVLIDGQQLDPTSFGEFDSTTGIWKPKKIGAQFGSGGAGTNGFYLDFKDSSNLGNDASGNNNDYTVNNLTSIDQSTDTCVENYATLNTLDNSSVTLSEGNLKASCPSPSGCRSTIAVESGKWYVEVKYTETASFCGVVDMSQVITSTSTSSVTLFGGSSGQPELFLNGSAQSDYSSAGTLSAGDIIQIALDKDNNNVYFGKNGSWFGGTNWTESSPTTAHALSSGSSYVHGFRAATGSGTRTNEWNFGNPPYSISSGNSDANGFGNFEYSVPSGYYALNTSNLNTYG